ncbi:MAG: Mov34/MPN/PAD-1 family protein [Planctomycetes bacterium]|nr:Mov34/MPN/PAD-1 family protein [Planctomycetota bacterium]
MPSPRGSTTTSGTVSLRGKAIGALYDDACRIVVAEKVLESIIDYSEHDLRRELGGFLLGDPPATEQRIVEVRDFLPAVDVQSRAASLTFTHDTWAAMTRDVRDRFPDMSVVGWHHTHPGLGIFLSGYDLFIHRHFFRAPWQVALVVDPRRQELGFFQWRGDQVTDCGFICKSTEE